eukprot:327226_1
MNVQLQEAELLLNGYINKYISRAIPIDILNMCLQYICNVTYCNFKNKTEISHFINARNGQIIRQYIIHNTFQDMLKDVEFKLNLYPNGDSLVSRNNVLFSFIIDVTNISYDVTDFAIYYEFHHKETKAKYKNIYKYKQTNQQKKKLN